MTITNFEKGSQLFIYTSELSDTGIYTVTIKNVVGQDTFSIEIRVTGKVFQHSVLLFIYIFILASFGKNETNCVKGIVHKNTE